MKDYRDIDTSQLTIEDALADEDFNKTPWDYMQFLAIDVDILENIQDATVDEVGQAFKAISDYCLLGHQPDYKIFSSSGVKMLIRSTIHDHEKRMNSEYLRHYRQFVSTQKKQQEKTLGKTQLK